MHLHSNICSSIQIYALTLKYINNQTSIEAPPFQIFSHHIKLSTNQNI